MNRVLIGLARVLSIPQLCLPKRGPLLRKAFARRGSLRRPGCKDAFWLDHPELGEVTTGLGFLCAKRRAKAIDLS